MGAISQVSEPSFQSWAIVLLNQGSVSDDTGLPSDGSPLSGRVDESDVNVRVAGDVVGLARLGIGVEEKVNAIGLLYECQYWISLGWR